MNRVSMFSRSRRRVPSARAKPPVKCSLRLLWQEQKWWMSGGWGENAKETAAFQTVTAARITHCNSSDRQLFELQCKRQFGDLSCQDFSSKLVCVCVCVQIRLCLKSGRK